MFRTFIFILLGSVAACVSTHQLAEHFNKPSPNRYIRLILRFVAVAEPPDFVHETATINLHNEIDQSHHNFLIREAAFLLFWYEKGDIPNVTLLWEQMLWHCGVELRGWLDFVSNVARRILQGISKCARHIPSDNFGGGRCLFDFGVSIQFKIALIFQFLARVLTQLNCKKRPFQYYLEHADSVT